MLRVGHGDLYQPQTKEERRKQKAEKRERDQIKFIDYRFKRELFVGLRELCRGKAMLAYTKPQQRKKEESRRLRGESSYHCSSRS